MVLAATTAMSSIGAPVVPAATSTSVHATADVAFVRRMRARLARSRPFEQARPVLDLRSC
jgi:hypothetical protein